MLLLYLCTSGKTLKTTNPMTSHAVVLSLSLSLSLSLKFKSPVLKAPGIIHARSALWLFTGTFKTLTRVYISAQPIRVFHTSSWPTRTWSSLLFWDDRGDQGVKVTVYISKHSW